MPKGTPSGPASRKSTRDLLNRIEAAGGTVKRVRRGFLIYGPTGTTTIHDTNSDPRAAQNVIKQLRHAGLEI